nr:hypothetical protein [Tanacetum cinerariifolium]
MDANKKFDLENPLCSNESKILINILQYHPLRFGVVTSLLLPWIYLRQFWHPLKENGSKYKLSFMLDKKKLTMTLDDFRMIFHLPQAVENNHECFIPATKLSEEIEKLVEGTEHVENVKVDSSTVSQNDNQNDPDTRTYFSWAPISSQPKFFTRSAISIISDHERQCSATIRCFTNLARTQDDPYDDVPPEGENSAKRQKISEHGTYASRESTSG